MSARTDLAWAAGFFDGEGSTYTAPANNNSSSIRIGISQNDPEVLERFAEAVGVGRITGPHPYGTNPRWNYQTGGLANVQYVLGQLWPWLGKVKLEQAREAARCFVTTHGTFPRTSRISG